MHDNQGIRAPCVNQGRLFDSFCVPREEYKFVPYITQSTGYCLCHIGSCYASSKFRYHGYIRDENILGLVAQSTDRCLYRMDITRDCWFPCSAAHRATINCRWQETRFEHARCFRAHRVRVLGGYSPLHGRLRHMESDEFLMVKILMISE